MRATVVTTRMALYHLRHPGLVLCGVWGIYIDALATYECLKYISRDLTPPLRITLVGSAQSHRSTVTRGSYLILTEEIKNSKAHL